MVDADQPTDETQHFDVFIIGGGINGAGVALEAARHGYSVCLCDSGDFGGGTSSASTKLIHGGLRYLEHFEFRLVREALKEREVLWKMAPHIIWPMRFVLPHHKALRPAWLLRLGLFIYDHLGARKHLPATETINLAQNECGKPLKKHFRKAFEYSDCWVEDSRLVILNLKAAKELGADIRPRTPVHKAAFKEGLWHLEIERSNQVTASIVINATGPWVDEVLRTVFECKNAQNVRLVRGSHIVIKKKFDHDRSYIFQNADNRIVFAIPYENEFTLIGTTDVEQEDMSTAPKISDDETRYLCKTVSEYFEEPVTEEDIVWSYSGVRPLYDDGASKAQQATRDYVIQPEERLGQGQLINIFGGKITTFRKLAQSLVDQIKTIKPTSAPNTNRFSHFAGGDFPIDGFERLVDAYHNAHPYLNQPVIKRLVRHYGTAVSAVLENVKSLEDLGQHFGASLYEAELRYLIAEEWVQQADDVLYRRTKLGLHMNEMEKSRLADYFAQLKNDHEPSRKVAHH